MGKGGALTAPFSFLIENTGVLRNLRPNEVLIFYPFVLHLRLLTNTISGFNKHLGHTV